MACRLHRSDLGPVSYTHLDSRVNHGAAACHLADGAHELIDVGHALLEQVGTTAGAFLEQRERVLRFGVLAQHNNADVGTLGAQALGGPQPLVGP